MAWAHRVGERDGRQPHAAGAQHRRGDDGGRSGRPDAQDHRRREGRDPSPQEHDQHDGRSALVVRRRGDACCPRGRHRGPARRPGERKGRERHLEGLDRQRELHGDEPDDAGARDRQGRHRGRRRRPEPEVHDRGARRSCVARRHDQRDDRHAAPVRRPGDGRRARGGNRRRAGWPGGRAGRVRYVEGAHRQRELDGEQPDDSGAQHRRGDDGGRPRRPEPQDHRAGEGRGRRARRNDQHNGRPAIVVRGRGDARCARGRRRRPPRRPG